MGLFSQRPEEPNEWAGLPSEPARAESTVERLSDAAPLDLGVAGLSLGPTEFAGTIETIVIPLTPVAPTATLPSPEADSSD